MLGLGIIGLGYWGPNLARNTMSSGVTQLTALCDRDPERLELIGSHYPTARQYIDPLQLLTAPDVDAVVVATPVASHFELAKAALEHGKHVLVEKPFTSNSEEGEELVSLAATRGRVLMVDHVFLFSPAVQKLGNLHARGELGELLFVDSVRINLGLFQHDVNVLWDLAPHDLSIVDFLLGRAPRGVVAIGSPQGLGPESVAHLHLDYGNDLLASIHVNWLSPVKIRHFLIGGSRRSVLYNDLDQSEPVKVYDRGIDISSDTEGRREALVSYRSGDVVCPKVAKTEPLENMIRHFAGCASTGTTPISSGEQGLRLVRILEAADNSLAKAGAYVEIAGE